jgi:hypothetical protein
MKPPADEDFAPLCDFGPPQTSRRARVSLILGVCSFVLCFMTAVPAIFFGIRSLVDIHNPKKNLSGTWMAISGITLAGWCVIMWISLLLSGIQGFRGGYSKALCGNNLKRIALAMRLYEQEHGCLPPAAIFARDGRPLLSWRVLLLPYLEHGDLFAKFHLNEPWDSLNNKPLGEMALAEFQCPSDPHPGMLTNYQVVVDPGSIFTGKRAGVPTLDVTDGLGDTLLVVEAAHRVPWSKPEDITLARVDEPAQRTGSNHAGGFNAAMADCSIRFIKTK